MKKAAQMTNYEILDYFGLVDEDETAEELEDFEQLEIEADDGRQVVLTMEDLKKAYDEGKVLTDLLITD
jgi:hypothetical protein